MSPKEMQDMIKEAVNYVNGLTDAEIIDYVNKGYLDKSALKLIGTIHYSQPTLEMIQ